MDYYLLGINYALIFCALFSGVDEVRGGEIPPGLLKKGCGKECHGNAEGNC